METIKIDEINELLTEAWKKLYEASSIYSEAIKDGHITNQDYRNHSILCSITSLIFDIKYSLYELIKPF